MKKSFVDAVAAEIKKRYKKGDTFITKELQFLTIKHGARGGALPSTITALVERGLIEKTEGKVRNIHGGGAFVIYRYVDKKNMQFVTKRKHEVIISDIFESSLSLQKLLGFEVINHQPQNLYTNRMRG